MQKIARLELKFFFFFLYICRGYDGICPTLKTCFSLVIHVIATGSNINKDVPDELLNFDSQNLYFNFTQESPFSLKMLVFQRPGPAQRHIH